MKKTEEQILEEKGDLGWHELTDEERDILRGSTPFQRVIVGIVKLTFSVAVTLYLIDLVLEAFFDKK